MERNRHLELVYRHEEGISRRADKDEQTRKGMRQQTRSMLQ